MLHLLFLFLTCLFPSAVYGLCCDPSPAFPLPQYHTDSHDLQEVLSDVSKSMKKVVSSDAFHTSSFSVEVTSSKETLWSLYHTAKERPETRPGTSSVNGSSVYRIASITKVFTVLGVIYQHVAGKLNLDDTIDQYIPELKGDRGGNIPWKDITLRSLASQLSGIPNDWAQSDILTGIRDPSMFGLPPATNKGLPKCDSYSGHETPCSRKDLLDTIRGYAPLFPPNLKSTYSNLAFELLGLALENATGKSYAECIVSSILTPLGMDSTSFAKPDDLVAVIPKGQHYWDIDEGVQNPTGGLYSTSNDLSAFLRYILTHYNGLTPTLNWIQPASFSTGMNSFYGAPFEIFRTDKILNQTNRPVTFVTKGGGVPGYFSNIMVLPEYDLGVTILVAGNPDLLAEIREAVTVPLVQAAEAIAQKALKAKYTGTYTVSPSKDNSARTTTLNSSISLSQSPHAGLYIDGWISNGTDLLIAFEPLAAGWIGYATEWRAQLVPTLLFRDEEKQAGEIWRVEIVPEGTKKAREKVWDDFSITHIDNVRYAGVPLNEFVFWEDAAEIELSAFRVRLRKQREKESGDSQLGEDGQKVIGV